MLVQECLEFWLWNLFYLIKFWSFDKTNFALLVQSQLSLEETKFNTSGSCDLPKWTLFWWEDLYVIDKQVWLYLDQIICLLSAFVHNLYIMFVGLCHHRQKPETQGKYKVVSLSKVYVRVTCHLICIFYWFFSISGNQCISST